MILEQYGLIKADEAQYAALDKEYLLGSRKEPYGYACPTNDRKYYEENVPGPWWSGPELMKNHSDDDRRKRK